MVDEVSGFLEQHEICEKNDLAMGLYNALNYSCWWLKRIDKGLMMINHSLINLKRINGGEKKVNKTGEWSLMMVNDDSGPWANGSMMMVKGYVATE